MVRRIQDQFSEIQSPQYRHQLRMNAQGLCVCGNRLKTKRHCKLCAAKHTARVTAARVKKKAQLN